MSTLFPTSIDSPVDPIATNPLNNPSHSGQHQFENDAIVALETKVGVNNSAVTTTLDYLLKSTLSVDPGHKHSLASLSDFSVTSPANGNIFFYNSSTSKWTNMAFSNYIKFGGTGVLGALNISAGTTTLSLGNSPVAIFNYTSISITGGNLAFSNPASGGTVIILKSQGNVTITSGATRAIDARGMGAAAVTSGFAMYGNPVNGSTTTASSTGGGAGTAQSPKIYTAALASKNLPFIVGSGGGNGSNGTNGGGSNGTGGAGAAGGPALIIECAGAYNVTGTIDVSGSIGSNGGNGAGAGGGGGGSGGGGSVIALYNSLTADTGTYTVSGGTASSGGTGSATGGGGGGGGGGSITGGNNGSNSGGGDNGGGGGVGGNGFSLRALNTEFA